MLKIGDKVRILNGRWVGKLVKIVHIEYGSWSGEMCYVCKDTEWEVTRTFFANNLKSVY